jgi:type IV pilus assembly protein PilB
MARDPRIQEEQIAAERAALLKSPYQDARQIERLVNPEGILSLEQMQQYRVVPLLIDTHGLVFGYTQDTKKSDLDQIKERLKNFNLSFSFISGSGYRELLERYYEILRPIKREDPTVFAKRLAQGILEEHQAQQADPELFTRKLADTTQKELLLLLVQHAYLLGSSDIHVEPSPQQIRIRFRIDGTLHDVATLPADRYQLLLNNLQMRSGIRWNANYPQTGRTTAELVDLEGNLKAINMRVETIPTMYASDIVIRLFNMEVRYLTLENLGLSKEHEDHINQLIAHPHGLVLMVGPTGSGKTSTLYSIINKLNNPNVKIVTLEDPVEYELGGITQIPVYSDDRETFADRLRAVLREDPDIIMVGEIRDNDTAKTALQAALTGHLVLSTFHANSAAAAISRLMDMIGQNPLLASAVKIIMAQRLLRRLCEHCKAKYTPEPAEVAKIRSALSSAPKTVTDKLNLDQLALFKPSGCQKCFHIGYRGRVMIAEQLTMSQELEKLLAAGGATATAQQIHDVAVKNGMVTLLQDGLLKAIGGITSIEEVYRVIEAA